MPHRPLVSVLIPAFNEESSIGETVAAAFKVPPVTEVIVADDGSSDQTAAVARAAGAQVVRLAENKGKGGALRTGLAVCKGEVVVTLDADVGESAAEISRLLEPVLRGEADMTIARFSRVAHPAGFGIAKGLAVWGIRRLANLQVESPLSGQRAVRREVIDRLGGFAAGWGVEVGLTIDAVRAGFKVMEVPVRMEHAATGRDIAGFIHRGKQCWHILGVIGRRMLYPNALPAVDDEPLDRGQGDG